MRTQLLVVPLLAVAACGREDAQPAAAETIAVTVQPARLETLRDVLTLPGTVVPSALADHTVVALESAEILELPKAEGATVRDGDVLVRFEIPTLTTNLLARQAEVGEASQRAEFARAEVTRLTPYFEKGVLPRNTLDAAREKLASAEAALGQAKAALDAAKALAERAVIRARFTGTVIKVWHKPGDLVTPDAADPILRVIDPSRTQVAMQAPLAQVERLTPGRAASILQPGTPAIPATVSSRSVAHPGAATAEVRVSLQAPSTLPPPPIDAVVQVEIQLDERKDVVVVPEHAVVREGNTAYVWIAREDARAERRAVRVGLTVNGLAQVLTGVQVGERVITTGLTQLQDGAPIVVSR